MITRLFNAYNALTEPQQALVNFFIIGILFLIAALISGTEQY